MPGKKSLVFSSIYLNFLYHCSFFFFFCPSLRFTFTRLYDQIFDFVGTGLFDAISSKIYRLLILSYTRVYIHTYVQIYDVKLSGEIHW